MKAASQHSNEIAESEPCNVDSTDSRSRRVNDSRSRLYTSKRTILFLCYAIVLLCSSCHLSEGSNDSRQNSLPSYFRLSRNNHRRSNRRNTSCRDTSIRTPPTTTLRGGAAAALNPFPSGYNPFGYRLTDLGKAFLAFDGSLDSDVGRFLSTLKGGRRRTAAAMKEQWLEIVRVSKRGQSLRIYRTLDGVIEFCLAAGFLD